MKLVEVVLMETRRGGEAGDRRTIVVMHGETQYLHPDTIDRVRSGHQHEPPKGQVFPVTTEILFTDGQRITVIGALNEIVSGVNRAME